MASVGNGLGNNLKGLTSKVGSIKSKMNFSGMNSGKILGNALANMKGGMGAAKKFDISGAQSILGSISSGGLGKLSSYVYKYKVHTYTLLIDGQEPINLLSEAIKQIIITKDYDQCIHPILEVVTLLPPKVHQLIKDNKQTAKIHLDIKKEQYSKNGNLVRSKKWINDKFSLIMDDESDFKDEEEYEQTNKAAGGDGKKDKYIFNIGDYSLEYTLSLWNLDHINAMRKMINDVYTDCTISTVIGNIYTKATGIKKIIISPLDNTKQYSEVRMKPMNLMNVPAYLDKVYGTYYTGSCVFLDFDRLYFLSKNGACDAKEKGEYTRTILNAPKPTQSQKNSTGTTIDTKNKFYYINLNSDAIDFQAPTNSKDATEGNNFSFIDPKNNETTEVTGAGSQSGDGNSRIVEDNYNNEYNKSTMMAEVVESSKEATVTALDFDDDAFTPNKEFIIRFEDEKFKDKNGFYRLKNSSIILSKSDASLNITGTFHLAFKANISDGDTKDKGKAVTKETLTTTPDKDTKEKPMVDTKTDKVANAATTKDSFKPSFPQPKVAQMAANKVNVTGITETNITKNTKYNYDALGNLKGIKVPSYNIITDKDDKLVRSAKLKAQQKLLPSKFPQPKLQKK